jgi:hypothetical protein
MTIEKAIKYWQHILSENAAQECDFWDDGTREELADAIVTVFDAIGVYLEAAAKPLTLDELLQMNGEPVWVENLQMKPLSSYGIVSIDEEPYSYVSAPLADYSLSDYGGTWIAYRRKPNEDLEVPSNE